jgi:hypothetical protein
MTSKGRSRLYSSEREEEEEGASLSSPPSTTFSFSSPAEALIRVPLLFLSLCKSTKAPFRRTVVDLNEEEQEQPRVVVVVVVVVAWVAMDAANMFDQRSPTNAAAFRRENEREREREREKRARI